MDHRYEDTFIETGECAILFGLNWRQLPGLGSEGSEIRELAKELSARRYVTVRKDGHDTYVGFIGQGVRLPKKLPAYSAAALLAAKSASSNAVFFWKSDDGETAYMASVRGGEPTPEFDAVGPLADVKERANEFVAICTGEGVSFYGNATEEFHDLLERGIDFLFEDNPDLKTQSVKTVPLVPLWAVAVVGAVVIGLAGYIGSSYIKKRGYVPPVVIAPEEAYAQSLAEAAATSGPALKSGIAVFEPALRAIGSTAGGWDLRSLSCNMVDGACNIEWFRTIGDNRTLAATAPRGDGFAPVAFGGVGDSAKQAMSLKKDAMAAFAVEHAKLPEYNEFIVGFGSMIQKSRNLGVTAKLGDPAPYATPATVPDPSSIPGLIRSGGWTVSMPIAMYRLLELFPANMTILSVKFEGQSAANFTVTAEGYYYVK